MRWTKFKLLIFLCYFCGCSCFCLAAFLPQLVELSSTNVQHREESRVSERPVKKDIVQTEKKKKKKKPIKVETETACNY